ncbi:hypothetical protein B0H13DRAFT_1858294 [Mycena leptocephala]|nr:hypothetical protein B0H13DRAFT_1858294 [Mycena leptocephala]
MPGLVHTKEEFEAKLEGIIEVALLPLIQKNVLKIEMNDQLDDYAKASAISLAEPIVLVMAQSESADQFIRVLRDSAVQKVFECDKEFGLYGGTCAFGVDVVPKVDSSVTPMGVAWHYNNYLDDAIQGFGYPAVQPLIVYRAESRNLDNAHKVLTDAGFRKSIQEGGEHFSLSTDACIFAVDLVTKPDLCLEEESRLNDTVISTNVIKGAACALRSSRNLNVKAEAIWSFSAAYPLQ